MMQNKILQNRKGPAPGDKKCYALNTSGGYISATLSIGAFGWLLVRARKSFDGLFFVGMIPDTDKAYIAGLFDGEGSIHFKRGPKRKRTQR